MTRSTWARRCGVAAAVAAVALVAAACSSQPSASRSTKAQAKAHEVTFPAPYGVMTPYSYGPSWARFVAAFPVGRIVNYSGATTNGGRTYGEVPCIRQRPYRANEAPSFDATDGHGGTYPPPPPSFNVRIWHCPSVTRARTFYQPVLALRGVRHIEIDGHPAIETLTSGTYRGGHIAEEGDIYFRIGSRIFDVEAVAHTLPIVRAFLGSFSLDTSGYQPAPPD